MKREEYIKTDSWIDQANDFTNPNLLFAQKALSFLRKGCGVKLFHTGPEKLNCSLGDHAGSSIPNLIFKTGGTTGVPKDVVHDSMTIFSAVESLCLRTEANGFSCVQCLPLHHIGGWMQLERAWRTGGTVFFCNYRDLNQPELKKILQGRLLSLVPTQLHCLVTDSKACSNLRGCSRIFVGGAAMSEELAEMSRKENLPIVPCYGMTETAGMITMLDYSDFAAGQNGVGSVLPNTEMRSSEKDGSICVRTKSLCHSSGSESYHANQWFETADFGIEDKIGHWNILGRLDGLINSGGEKVNPVSVQQAIMATGHVRECLVATEPNEKWGETMLAWVTPRNCPIQKIKDSLKGNLRPFEIPKKWKTVEKLPLNEAGKHNIHI